MEKYTETINGVECTSYTLKESDYHDNKNNAREVLRASEIVAGVLIGTVNAIEQRRAAMSLPFGEAEDGEAKRAALAYKLAKCARHIRAHSLTVLYYEGERQPRSVIGSSLIYNNKHSLQGGTSFWVKLNGCGAIESATVALKGFDFTLSARQLDYVTMRDDLQDNIDNVLKAACITCKNYEKDATVS